MGTPSNKVCELKQYNRAAKKALYETKSWGRKGRKGWAKKVAHRAIRRFNTAACRED
jgi:hypothetical protein